MANDSYAAMDLVRMRARKQQVAEQYNDPKRGDHTKSVTPMPRFIFVSPFRKFLAIKCAVSGVSVYLTRLLLGKASKEIQLFALRTQNVTKDLC